MTENEVKSLIDQYNNNNVVGVITDADTVLADIMDEAAEEGFDITGLGKEILDQWLKTSDKKAYESLFYNLTNCDFETYLRRVKQVQDSNGE